MFLTELLRSVFGNSGNDYETLGDSAAVLEAILERTDGGVDIQMELGAPELIDRGNTTQDLWVVIPTETQNGPDPADLEFDLPSGAEDEASELLDVLYYLDIDGIENLHEIVGQTVPAVMEAGTLVPDFEALGQ